MGAVASSPYDRGMTVPPSPSEGRGDSPVVPVRSRPARASTTGSIALVVLCALLAISAGGNYGGEHSTFPPVVRGYAMVSVFPMIGVSVLLLWRHRRPELVSAIATACTLVMPTTPLPALIALAALTAVRTGWWRWGMIAASYAATVVSFCWDIASHTSLLSNFFDAPAEGTPARVALFWVVPLLAAFAVAPFAVYGILRAVRTERDAARSDTAAASRNVAVLHREVERERERQELARELHDTLAARLSSLSLHAGALELTSAAGDERATAAARTVRESAQQSLDDLRNIVKVLRDPALGGDRTGLTDLSILIDDAVREGMDVRAQVLVTDPGSCDPSVAHACYRLMQESISNARRHAPGAVLRLEVRGSPETGLSITAVNWLRPGVGPTSVGGGHGLVGMRERVTHVGGSFQAGATEQGTFAIVAWMPWQPR